MSSVCAACQSALIPGAAFCTACGARVGADCSSCGRSLLNGAAFCVHCGTRQTAAALAPAVAATVVASQRALVPTAGADEAWSGSAPAEPDMPAGPPPQRRSAARSRGPLLSTRALAVTGGAVLVGLVVVIVLRTVGGGAEPPRDEQRAALPAAPTRETTASPVPTDTVAATATPDPTRTPAAEPTATPAALPEEPSTNAAELAREVDRAEEILHDAQSPAEEIVLAGRYEQMAARRLARETRAFRREALAAMGSDAHATMRAAVDAARAIALVVEPQERFPKWRIISPPPAPRLLRYFQSAQEKTGVPWQYLAAIQFVETRFGRIDGVSSAGARGPMQFLPATWARYGSGDIEDQRDSILAAARYLVANGAPVDMAGALYHYNPSRGYVRAIRLYAERMAADEQAFFGFYGWQVLYKHVDGTMILPEGYPKVRPVPAPVE